MSSNAPFDSVPGGRHTSHVSPQLQEQERQRTLYQLERERFDEWRSILSACDVDGKRMVLAVILINNGVCTYKTLYNNVARHKRKIKKHIYDLADMGIINNGGNPASVTFVDTDIYLMVSDALHHTDKL